MKNLLITSLILVFTLPILSQDKYSLQASISNDIYINNHIDYYNISSDETKNSSSENLESKDNKKSKVNPLGFRYYYFPNMSCYLDTVNDLYIYRINNTWEKSKDLPSNYGGYSMFKGMKVRILNYIDDNPEEFIIEHRKEFPYNSKGRFTYKIE